MDKGKALCSHRALLAVLTTVPCCQASDLVSWSCRPSKCPQACLGLDESCCRLDESCCRLDLRHRAAGAGAAARGCQGIAHLAGHSTADLSACQHGDS